MDAERGARREAVSSPRILFVCIENSCRSQIAEAFARMHGGAGVLDRRVAQDRDLSGVGVDLDIDDVVGEAATLEEARIDRAASRKARSAADHLLA